MLVQPSQSTHQRAHGLVDVCATFTGEKRTRAAASLSRLGVQRRGSIRTLGSLRVPAEDRFTDTSAAEQLALALSDPDPAVRGQVALAIGEWGGEGSVDPLAKQLATDEDEDVRLFSVAALRLIGGDQSAQALALAAQSSTEAVRDAALSGVQELATGGGLTDMDSPLSRPRESGDQAAPSSSATRGAVRTRGRKSGEIPDRLVQALESVRTDISLPAYLRQKAGEVIDLMN